MPESEMSTMVILLASCAGLLVLVLLLVFRISRRLARIEGLARSGPEPPGIGGFRTIGGGNLARAGRSRRFSTRIPRAASLPKGEQFSAYRQWRQEKGMNWSNS